MTSTLIKNALFVNEGEINNGNILIRKGIIEKIYKSDEKPTNADNVIDAKGFYLIPGIIDDQVHFREPGLTHKGDIQSESAAAVAGGVTSYLEMPNTIPQTTRIEELRKKHQIAANHSLCNYSFYFGATNDNIEEIKKLDTKQVCGLKVFMGSSTGNMLVDNIGALEMIFAESPVLIATHCEDENIIKKNHAYYYNKYGDFLPFKYHPLIRSAEACYKSSELAVKLAHKYNSRLHVLHLSTARETELFESSQNVKDKRITAEICVHHLWFNDSDYEKYGARIKWNPAVKSKEDQDGLLQALLNNKIDIIATDHAPHTLKEKNNSYFNCPSGGPLVQHSLVAMLEMWHQGKIKLENIVTKMCHNPAKLFSIENRGFIKEGYAADLVIFNPNDEWEVNQNNILYKCKWSPFEGQKFKSKVTHTFVNGNLVFNNNNINTKFHGKALTFKH